MTDGQCHWSGYTRPCLCFNNPACSDRSSPAVALNILLHPIGNQVWTRIKCLSALDEQNYKGQGDLEMKNILQNNTQ